MAQKPLNPVMLDKSPLSKSIWRVQRGDSKIVGPSCHGKELVTVFCTQPSDCIYGELLGIELGIHVLDEDKPCCFNDDTCALLIDAPPGGPVAWAAVRARIRWCLGGANFEAIADWIDGTVVGVVAEQVDVCAEFIVVGDRDADCPLPDFKVNAGVGEIAPHFSSNSARLTTFVSMSAPGERRRIRVPAFAISVNALPIGADGGGPIHLELLGPCGPGVRFDVATPLGNTKDARESALPIPNGVRFVDVVNDRLSGAAQTLIIFGLAL